MIDPDLLPNPHLAGYLRPDYLSLNADAQRKELDRAELSACGLPPDYDSLSSGGKLQARMSVLMGWYDLDRPQVFCTDVEKLIQAHFLWVERYYKPCEHNKATYYWRDPKHKYRMVRAAMSPPVVATEPAKTVIHAPRGSTKTITLVSELCAMAAVCRPNTNLLVIEKNRARTCDEIKKIRQQIQNNKLIQQDFGGQGALWPRNNRTGQTWNDSELTFVAPRSSIVGVSAGSSHLGRHIPFVILDDAEDEKMYRNPELRRKFFVWLFQVVIPMLDAGGHLVWIGTPHASNSCIQIALDGVGRENLIGEEFADIRDARFTDWTRKRFKLVYEEGGERKSLFPDKMSVGAFDAKVNAIGRSSAMAEYQGEPGAEGEPVFVRYESHHGYMRIKDPENPGEVSLKTYFYCLATGRMIEWKAWLESLHIVSALDHANGKDSSSDYSSGVTIGVDPEGVVYVLDCSIRRELIDAVLKDYRSQVMYWKSKAAGIEKDGPQGSTVRLAWLEWERGRKAGVKMPPLTAMTSEGADKDSRIIGTLKPLYEDGKIRFLKMVPHRTDDGAVYEPIEPRNKRAYMLLLEMLDDYRESGASGHDDGPDALEQAIRLAGGRKGIEVVSEDANDAEYDEWKDAGVEWPLASIPREAMGPRMRQTMEESANSPVAVESEQDPYE